MAQPRNLFAPPTGPRSLLSFRAGRLDLVDGWVRPDERKGILSVVVLEGLVHLQWKERNAATAEESIPVYPRSATFAHVEKCTTGRVYALSTVDSSRVHFYWMQEPKAAKDEEHCEGVNRLLNCPNPAMLDPNAFLGPSFGFGGISQEQLFALLASRVAFMPGAYGTGSSDYGDSMPGTARRNQVELSTLQGILRDLGQPEPSPSTSLGANLEDRGEAAVVPPVGEESTDNTKSQQPSPDQSGAGGSSNQQS